jgi:uncharacterized protein YjaG (DUF416 family)
MAENNIGQVNNRLDRVDEILLIHSERLDVMTQAIERLAHMVKRADERREQALASRNQRLQAMEDLQQSSNQQLKIFEGLQQGSSRRLDSMEDLQRDMREMLQILIARSSG